MNQVSYDSPATDRSIFTRRVPGISNGELLDALQNDEKPRNAPKFNDAFSRTSPEIYQHHQNAINSSANMQPRESFGNTAANNVLLDVPQATAADNSQPSALIALQNAMIDIDGSVREYHAKEIVRHSQVLETLAKVQNQMRTNLMILCAVVAVVLALVAVLLWMVSRALHNSTREAKKPSQIGASVTSSQST